jgi:hypothetical protein
MRPERWTAGAWASRPRCSNPSDCARRSPGSRSRSGIAASSTTSERSARIAHSATRPRLRALPHRPLTPPRPLRIPRAAAGDPRAVASRRPATCGVGAHEGDPSRRGDPHRSHPDRRRRRRARRARVRRAGKAARTVPRAPRDASADGRRDQDRARRRDTKSRADVHAIRVRTTATLRPSHGGTRRCMSDGAASMKTAKRRINTEKHQRVQAVMAQIKDQGREDQLRATLIARRAGVHRSFVSNHFAGQLAHAKAEIQARFIAGLSVQTALSAASLRVEIETAKHQASEAQREIRDLKARLARTLGECGRRPTPGARHLLGDRHRPPRPSRATAPRARRSAPASTRCRGGARGGTTSEPHVDTRVQHERDRARAVTHMNAPVGTSGCSQLQGGCIRALLAIVSRSR